MVIHTMLTLIETYYLEFIRMNIRVSVGVYFFRGWVYDVMVGSLLGLQTTLFSNRAACFKDKNITCINATNPHK